MTQFLNHSDIDVIRSEEHEKLFVRGSAQTPPPTGADPATNRAGHTWVVDRDLQALWPAELSLHRRAWARAQAILVHGERPRLGYVPNATYPQVAAFLANYRKLQEMLNEICAINAELLRRRESLD